MTLGIVLVTAGSEAEAAAIAQALVEARLAACVNWLPVQSVYRWEGDVERASEWQLLIKTDLDRLSELAAWVQSHHSYSLPEVVALPIVGGSAPYLDWLRAQLQPAVE